MLRLNIFDEGRLGVGESKQVYFIVVRYIVVDPEYVSKATSDQKTIRLNHSFVEILASATHKRT